MEGQSAESSAGACEDGGPEEFGKEFFALPELSGIGGSDRADFGGREFDELRWEGARKGRGLRPGLETVSESHVELSGLQNRSAVAAGEVKDAAGPAARVCPGDVDAVGREKAGETVGMLDGGDLILTESEFGFFAAVTDAIGAEEEVADVPVRVSFVEARRGGGRKADVHPAPGFGLNTLGGEFLVEGGPDFAASKARGVVG